MKSIIAVAVVSFVSASAQAQGIFSKDFVTNMLSKKGTRLARAQDPACTNFGGEWAGTCTVNGANPRESTVNLQQIGCEGMGFQNIAIPLGGMVSVSSMPPKDASVIQTGTVQFQTAWNAAKTEIAGRVRVSTPEGGVNDVATILVNVKMNGKNMEVAQDIQVDGQPNTVIFCSYTRP